MVISVGDDCSSGSFPSVSLEFGVSVSLALGLPKLLPNHHLVANIHSRKYQLVVLHHVSPFSLHDVRPVEARQGRFVLQGGGKGLVAERSHSLEGDAVGEDCSFDGVHGCSFDGVHHGYY